MAGDWEHNDAFSALQFPCQVCLAGVEEFCMEPERDEGGLIPREEFIAAVCDRRRNRARALRLRAAAQKELPVYPKSLSIARPAWGVLQWVRGEARLEAAFVERQSALHWKSARAHQAGVSWEVVPIQWWLDHVKAANLAGEEPSVEVNEDG